MKSQGSRIAQAVTGIAVSLILLQQHGVSQVKQPPADADTKSGAGSKCDADQVDMLAGMALTLPPALTADALLRLEQMQPDRDKKLDYIQRAFTISYEAARPVRVEVWGGAATDSRSAFVASALRSGIDQLSLQARAVQAARNEDTELARNLFQSIRFPRLKPLTCNDSLVYDVSAYYNALADVAATISKEEIETGEYLSLLSPAVSQLAYAAQIGPLAASLLRVSKELRLSTSDISLLVNRFADRLGQVKTSHREFGASLYTNKHSVANLLYYCKQRGVDTTATLVAFKAYLARHMSLPACQGGDVKAADPLRIAADFNKLLEELDVAASVAAFETKDVERPMTDEAAPDAGLLWRSQVAQDLLQRVKELRFGDGMEPLDDEDRRESSWRAMWKDTLDGVVSWQTAASIDSVEYIDQFYEKAILLRALIDLAPDERLQKDALDAGIAFLSNSALLSHDPAAWLSGARVVLKGALRLDGTVPLDVVATMRASKSYAISFLAGWLSAEMNCLGHKVGARRQVLSGSFLEESRR